MAVVLVKKKCGGKTSGFLTALFCYGKSLLWKKRSYFGSPIGKMVRPKLSLIISAAAK